MLQCVCAGHVGPRDGAQCSVVTVHVVILRIRKMLKASNNKIASSVY